MSCFETLPSWNASGILWTKSMFFPTAFYHVKQSSIGSTSNLKLSKALEWNSSRRSFPMFVGLSVALVLDFPTKTENKNYKEQEKNDSRKQPNLDMKL